MAIDRDKLASAINGVGPNRVVIDLEGHSVGPARAREMHGIEWDIAWVRDDGWSLGAPSHLSHVAEELWRERWIGTLVRGGEILPYHATQR